MALAFTYHPLTTLTWVQSQTSMRGIGGGQSATGTGFSPYTLIFCVSMIP
jgi:hypothetical protein